jgi:sortase B
MEKKTRFSEKPGLRKKHWYMIGGACAAVVAFAVFGLFMGKGNTDVYDELRKEVTPVVIAPPEQPALPEVEPPPDNGIRPSDRDIDFDALFQRNPDAIAWITVEGTEIDYPILKSKDNWDYLVNDIDGKENWEGAIFMDMVNRPDFSDRNTVIYGHNMPHGTMFAGLHLFEDKAFFDENRIIKVYTPEGMRSYEIIAAYLTDDRNVLYQMDYSDDTVWKTYIESVYGNRDLNANLLERPIGADDRIITLSTCEQGQAKNRYLVQGALRKDAE